MKVATSPDHSEGIQGPPVDPVAEEQLTFSRRVAEQIRCGDAVAYGFV